MEFQLIERFRTHALAKRDDVVLGIGDDAAIVGMPYGHELVMSLDTLVEGTHFLPGTAPLDLGWKALAVNLSDLAAMGAEPAWAMLALTLPRADAEVVDGIAAGFVRMAERYRLALVGGDTTMGPLCLSVAIHGLVPMGQALTRHGAQPGDEVLVTGTLGDAMAGLYALRECPRDDAHHAVLRQSLVERLTRPEPRVAAGIALRGLASACVDVSDGLLGDLGHLCQRSGVGAVLQGTQLPCSPALRALHNEEEVWQWALAGGDDYELCFTVAPAHMAQVEDALAAVSCPCTRVGHIVRGEGVQVYGADGRALATPAKGWEHFA